MKARELRTQGLGCMGMSDFYGSPDDAESIAARYPEGGMRTING